MIEGEEEVGGANLETYVAENRDRLKCDYAVISDTSQFAPGIPAITYGWFQTDKRRITCEIIRLWRESI